MASKLENLKPFTSDQSREEAAKNGRKGGIASGEARRKRKTLREELIALLEQNEMQERISLALLEKALQGDTKAFEVMRDTIGEKPTEKVEADTKVEIVMSDDLEDYAK